MMKTISIAHSLFTQKSIAELIAEYYALPGAIHCECLHVGQQDYYEVCAGADRYVLRVDSPSTDTAAEEKVRFELDWLRFLKEKRCAVSYPLPQKTGDFIGQIEAPEGRRRYVLFSWAQGDLEPLSRKQAFLLGKEMARIHLISGKFETTHQGPLIDLHYLLETPIAVIKQYLGENWIDEQARLDALSTALKERILSLVSCKAHEWGLVSGGIDGFHQHWLSKHQLTLFHFNQCGYGWRAYDLAVFRHAQPSFLTWHSFLSGYQSVRRLSKAELAAIPLFMQVHEIFAMARSVSAPSLGVRMNSVWWETRFKRLFKTFH